jgi:hypothetical protein
MPSPHPLLTIPDDLRFITLYGVPYCIPWEDLSQGGSFFLKTTATARMVNAELRRHQEKLGLILKAVNRVEHGYYGVRVWRF